MNKQGVYLITYLCLILYFLLYSIWHSFFGPKSIYEVAKLESEYSNRIALLANLKLKELNLMRDFSDLNSQKINDYTESKAIDMGFTKKNEVAVGYEEFIMKFIHK